MQKSQGHSILFKLSLLIKLESKDNQDNKEARKAK